MTGDMLIWLAGSTVMPVPNFLIAMIYLSLAVQVGRFLIGLIRVAMILIARRRSDAVHGGLR